MRLTYGAHSCQLGMVGRGMWAGKAMLYCFSVLKALGDDVSLGWMCLKQLAKVAGLFEMAIGMHE